MKIEQNQTRFYITKKTRIDFNMVTIDYTKTKMKKSVKMVYFFADWDNNYQLKNDMYNECKKNGIFFDDIDCDTDKGVQVSIKYGVKLCPYIILQKDGDELWRGIANDFDASILKNLE